MNISFIGYSPNWPEKKRRVMDYAFLEYTVYGGSWLGYFACLPYLWLLMQRDKPDVIVAQTVYHGLIALLVRPRTPLIVENHGDLAFRNRTIAGFVIRRAKGLRAVSRYTCHEFYRFAHSRTILKDETGEQGVCYIPFVCPRIFPAWTDIDLFLTAYDKYKKPGMKIVLYAGDLKISKGIMHLLKAFSLLNDPEAMLLIAGKPEHGKFQEILNKMIEGYKVSLLGFLTQEQLARRMAQADVFVVPSLYEGYGRVALEAMACGTPVIASNVGGLKEIIEHRTTGFLVQPGDIGQLRDCMAYCLNNGVEARRIGHQAHLWAYKNYSTRMYVEAYKRLIEGVMK